MTESPQNRCEETIPPFVVQLLLLVLVAGVLIVYGDAFGHTFLLNWDDEKYVLRNTAAHGLSLAHIREAFSTYYVNNFAPVQIISYMIDYQFWQLKPAGYILTNLLLHSANGLLAYRLVVQLTARVGVGLMAAFIFLFHPVQVETVVWISQRKSLLATLFFLIAFISYSRFRREQRYGWYLLSLAAFTLSILSKAVTVIFPLLALLYDYCFRERNQSIGLWNKLPYLMAAALVGTLAIASHTPGYSGTGGINDYPGGSLLTTAYTMLPVLAQYLGNCLLPLNLSPYYLTTIRSHPDTAVMLATVLAMGLVALGWYLRRKDRRLLFWYLFFFINLLPVSQIIPLITLRNDRYLYIPLLGFATLAALALGHLAGRFPRHRQFLVVLTILLLTALPLGARHQTRIWQNAITLWSHAVHVDPENQLGWQMLAWAYTKERNAPAALHALDQAKRLREKNGPVRGWEGL